MQISLVVYLVVKSCRPRNMTTYMFQHDNRISLNCIYRKMMTYADKNARVSFLYSQTVDSLCSAPNFSLNDRFALYPVSKTNERIRHY